MCKTICLCLVSISLVVGCAQQKVQQEPPKAPATPILVQYVNSALTQLVDDLASEDEEVEEVVVELVPKEEVPVFSDALYGTGELGPRILAHSSQVTYIKPEKLEPDLVLQGQANLPKAPLSKEELAKILEENKVKLDAAKAPNELKEAREVKIWSVKEARSPHKMPLTKAKVDAKTYLAALGIESVYELSPHANQLAKAHFSFFPNIHSQTPVKGLNQAQWTEMIQSACQMFGLDPKFVAAIIKVESNFNPLVVSKAGAQGAMQIMPATQKYLGLIDPFDVRANIQAGCAYIHELLAKYGSAKLALAAYNAGPGAVDRYKGIPPYKETQNYVQKVMGYWLGSDAIAIHVSFPKAKQKPKPKQAKPNILHRLRQTVTKTFKI